VRRPRDSVFVVDLYQELVSPLSELESRIVAFFLSFCVQFGVLGRTPMAQTSTRQRQLTTKVWRLEQGRESRYPPTLQLDYRIVEVAPRLGLTIEGDGRGEDNFECLDDLLLYFYGLDW
jgi:hypothetical protein